MVSVPDNISPLVQACPSARVVQGDDGRVVVTGLDLATVDWVTRPAFVPGPAGVGIGREDLVWSGMWTDERWWLVLGGADWRLRALGFGRILDANGKFLGSSDISWPYEGWEPFDSRVTQVEMIPVDEVIDLDIRFDNGHLLQVFSRSPKFS